MRYLNFRYGMILVLLSFIPLFLSVPVLAADSQEIRLVWDPSNPESTYRVYSFKSGEANWSRIGEVITPEFTWTVTYGSKHYLYVTTVDSYGEESDPSNVVSWPIQVFAPMEGYIEKEILHTGTTYNIEWYAARKAERFKIMYSADNGATWVTITKEATGGHYLWTVPPLRRNKGSCLLRVVGFDSTGRRVGDDEYDEPLRIEVLSILSPTGGETLNPGAPLTVSWEIYETRSDVDRIKLFFTRNGGLDWELIDSLAGDERQLQWHIPDVKTSKKCRVRVVLKDIAGKTVGSATSGYFTIEH